MFFVLVVPVDGDSGIYSTVCLQKREEVSLVLGSVEVMSLVAVLPEEVLYLVLQ